MKNTREWVHFLESCKTVIWIFFSMSLFNDIYQKNFLVFLLILQKNVQTKPKFKHMLLLLLFIFTMLKLLVILSRISSKALINFSNNYIHYFQLHPEKKRRKNSFGNLHSIRYLFLNLNRVDQVLKISKEK